jgi:hypothetical protein
MACVEQQQNRLALWQHGDEQVATLPFGSGCVTKHHNETHNTYLTQSRSTAKLHNSRFFDLDAARSVAVVTGSSRGCP